jgi:hypothetical protein
LKKKEDGAPIFPTVDPPTNSRSVVDTSPCDHAGTGHTNVVFETITQLEISVPTSELNSRAYPGAERLKPVPVSVTFCSAPMNASAGADALQPDGENEK